MWEILICDDNTVRAAELRRSVQNVCLNRLSSVIMCDSKSSFRFFMDEQRINLDAAFIHTSVSDVYGVDVAKTILQKYPAAQIVFVANADRHIGELWEIDFAYRLQEPFGDPDVSKALDRIAHRMEKEENQFIGIRCEVGLIRVRLTSIKYFEKDGRRILLVGDEGRHAFYGSLLDIMPALTEDFVRCHNSYVVNMARADSMKGSILTMEDGTEIPVSRSYFKEVRNLYMKYYSGRRRKRSL